MRIYHIEPVSKPRMTQRDKWSKRPATLKYWRFKHKVKELGIELMECGEWVKFYIKMPKTWSKKKKDEMIGTPHHQRPDIDNLEKRCYDIITLAGVVFKDDCQIAVTSSKKVWSNNPRTEIEIEEIDYEN